MQNTRNKTAQAKQNGSIIFSMPANAISTVPLLKVHLVIVSEFVLCIIVMCCGSSERKLVADQW